jgi:hypothetical protein
MTDTKPRISFGQLPLRSKPLSEKELVGVFGGCAESGAACNQASNCCAGLVCSAGTCRSAADAAL